jgi:hypothetical protein
MVFICIQNSSARCYYYYYYYLPPLWSSGQSSWLQIQRSGFDFKHYQIF